MSIPVEFTKESKVEMEIRLPPVCLTVLEKECLTRPNTLVSINIDEGMVYAVLLPPGKLVIHIMKYGYGYNPLPEHLQTLPSYTLGAWFGSIAVELTEVYKHVFNHTTPTKDFRLKDAEQTSLRSLNDGQSFTKKIDGVDRTFIKFNRNMGVTYRTDTPQNVRMLLFIEAACSHYEAEYAGGGGVSAAHTGLGGRR